MPLDALKIQEQVDKKKSYYNSLYNGIQPKFPYHGINKRSLLSPESRNTHKRHNYAVTEKKDRHAQSFHHTQSDNQLPAD